MKSWIKFIPVLILIAQTSEAQYRLAAKGERVPYDSAVITELPTWRKESAKFAAAQQYIAGLRIENDSLLRQLQIRGVLTSAHEFAISELQQSAKRNEETFSALNGKFDKLYAEATKPRKWYEKPVPLLLLGAAAGYLITR
jgi:hypothetical protein